MKSVIKQRGMTLLELSVVLLILIALAGLAVPYVAGVSSTAACQATDATMQTAKEAIMGGPSGVGYYADLLGQYPRDKWISGGSPSYSLHYLFERDDGVDNDGDGHNSSPSYDGVFDPDDEWRSYDAKSGVGWRGPYLTTGVTVTGLIGNFTDTAYVHALADGQLGVNDAWGRPLALQMPNQTTCDALTGRTTKPGDCVRLVSAGQGSGVGIGNADIDSKIDDATLGAPAARRINDDRMLYLRIPSPALDANPPCYE